MEQFQRVVSRAAANVQHRFRIGSNGGCSLGDHLQNQGSVHRSGLARLQLGEPLHIVVESLANLLNRGFHDVSSAFIISEPIHHVQSLDSIVLLLPDYETLAFYFRRGNTRRALAVVSISISSTLTPRRVAR